MSEEQKRVVDLIHLLGLALGALEVIRIMPYDFNHDGLEIIINRLRSGLDPKPEELLNNTKITAK